MSYSLVVFDFDGTLVDSESCIRQSLTFAIRRRGLEVPEIRKEWIGLPLHSIVRDACPGIADYDVETVIADYRRHYAEIDAAVTHPFPGIIDLLETLRARGIRMAIATNKHSTPATATLQRLGILAWFDIVAGGESVPQPKPHPDLMLRVLQQTGSAPASALMVGDATVDIEMAHAAGVSSCAVTWGNHAREQLVACRPRYVIDSPIDLLQVITR